jgi:hypothetical protein
MRSTGVPQQALKHKDRQERLGEVENKMEGPYASSETGTGSVAYSCGVTEGEEEEEDCVNFSYCNNARNTRHV